MSDAVTKRNITALHENSKILHGQISELRDEINKLSQMLAQSNASLLQLKQQVILQATNVGRGPTDGNNH